MSESKPKGRRQGGRRNNNEATPGSTYGGGQLPQKSQQQQVQQQQQTHPEGGKGGKGGKGGGRGRNRNRAKGGQAATPNVDTNALNGGMNASANHSSGGKAADMFDEETALSRFRELLKSGDQGAKEVHAAFMETRDREVFQAKVMELVLARSAASAASTAPVAAASVAQPTDNSGALPARESAAAAPSLRTAMPTEVDEGGDSGAAWERLVAGALHQPSGSAASSGPPGLGNGFGNGFGGAFSGGGVGNGSLGGLGVTSTGEDGGDGSFGNAFSQQQEAFGRWVAATNNQEGGAGGEVDSGLRSQVAGLSLGASSNTQAPPPGFGGLFGNNSVGLGGSSDAPKPPSLPAPPSQDGFGFENSSSNGLFGNSNGAISSSPPAASSAPDGLPPHLQNLFGPSLPGVRGPGGFPHPSASSNNGGNMGLPPHLLMNEVPPEGLPVDEQDAWRQQRAAQLQFLERRAAHDQMMAARQQQFYQMQMMQFQQQQQQQQQPRVPPPGVVLPPQPPAASDPWASSSVPSAAGGGGGGSSEGRRSRSVSFNETDIATTIPPPSNMAAQQARKPSISEEPSSGAEEGKTGAPTKPVYEPKRINEPKQGRLTFEVSKREMLAHLPPRLDEAPEMVLKVQAVRSRARMLVSWHLPSEVVRKIKASNDGAPFKMVLGLVRIGVPSNKTSVVNKALGASDAPSTSFPGAPLQGPGLPPPNSPQALIGGKKEFYAPRSVGVFVYRLFNELEPVTTYASSLPFAVGVQFRDLDQNLKFVKQHLEAKKVSMALRQLAEVFEHLHPPLPWLPSGSNQHSGGGSSGREVENALLQAMSYAQSESAAAAAIEENKKQKEAELQEQAPDMSAEDKEKAQALAASDGKALRYAAETHLALRQVLSAAETSLGVWSGLSEGCRAQVQAMMACYSRISDRFFPSIRDVEAHHFKSFGHIPRYLTPPLPGGGCGALSKTSGGDGSGALQLPPAMLESVSKSMHLLLPSLLPSETFAPQREELVKHLEAIVLEGLGDSNATALGGPGALRPLTQLPKGASLTVFGSSANGFGSDHADLDMCLLVPPPPSSSSKAASANGKHLMNAPPPVNKPELVEGIGRALREASASGQLPNLTSLNSRASARIPVVNFMLDGIDCDISVHNPLAVRNTRLLATYAKCDPRLREVAYVVKHWAKRRKVNNASEGTLSSYGYLLCLVHFLQTRNPPVLPNLQALPPNWNGDPASAPLAPRRSDQLPNVMVCHPVDGRPVDTYFYEPPNGDYRALANFGRANQESVGALLVGFFYHLGGDFDMGERAVAVRSGVLPLSKLVKAEVDCWPTHTRLSIEDPFETWYDVAHPVKKQSRFEWTKAELLRAYSLCRDAAASHTHPSQWANLLDEICSEAPPPPFTYDAKRHRAESQDFTGDA